MSNPSRAQTAGRGSSAPQTQPIVRVMRLYKKGLHGVPSMTALRVPHPDDTEPLPPMAADSVDAALVKLGVNIPKPPKPTSTSTTTTPPAAVELDPLSAMAAADARKANNSNVISKGSQASHRTGDLGEIALSPFLMLPDSFGDIYMGEVFSAYISVVNPGGEKAVQGVHESQGEPEADLHRLSVRFHLQVGNNTHELEDERPRNGPTAVPEGDDPTSPAFRVHSVQPRGFVDAVVQRRLTELGTHTLRVTIEYQVGSGVQELKTLRKFYRFNVLQPLVVRACARELELGAAGGNRVAVQVMIKNSAQTPVLLEDIRFHGGNSLPALTTTPLSPPFIGEEKPMSTVNDVAFALESQRLLQPGECYASGLVLSRKTPTNTSGAQGGEDNDNDSDKDKDKDKDSQVLSQGDERAQGGSISASDISAISAISGGSDKVCPRSDPQVVLGRVEVMWSSHLGERGLVQSAAISLPGGAPLNGLLHRGETLGDGPAPPLELSVLQCPSSLPQGQSAPLVLQCSNVSSSSMAELKVQTVGQSGQGLCVTGVSRLTLGLEAGESKELHLQLKCISPGLHSLKGLQVSSVGEDWTEQVLWDPEQVLAHVRVTQD